MRGNLGHNLLQIPISSPALYNKSKMSPHKIFIENNYLIHKHLIALILITLIIFVIYLLSIKNSI